ncbi:MAG: phosphoribosylaminoimidazolesuccinocarboxamide synthase [Elusimicrobiota bacterium]
MLAGRTMLVKKTRAIPIECVVRGYLAGSGWKEYQQSRSICGIPLPPGLRESEQLPNPIFMPSTKEETGHDINISQEEMARRIGEKLTQELKEASLAFYALASDYTKSRGFFSGSCKLFGCKFPVIVG